MIIVIIIITSVTITIIISTTIQTATVVQWSSSYAPTVVVVIIVYRLFVHALVVKWHQGTRRCIRSCSRSSRKATGYKSNCKVVAAHSVCYRSGGKGGPTVIAS
jgi:hypothetical protein